MIDTFALAFFIALLYVHIEKVRESLFTFKLHSAELLSF